MPTNGEAGTIRFNYTFPDGNVESVPKIQADYDLQLTGTTGLTSVGSLYGALGLRQYALNRHFQNARVEMNGHEITSRPAEIVECLVNSQSLTQLSMLSDAPAGSLSNTYSSTFINSTIRQGANTIDAVSSNGIGNNWDLKEIIKNANNNFTIKIRYTEAVIAQPFQYQERNPVPFRNLRDFKLDLDMTSILGTTGDFLGIDSAHVIAGTSVACSNADYRLLVHTWNPSLAMDIPKTIVWNSPEVSQLASTTKSLQVVLPEGGNNIIESGSFVLNSVPTALFIYAKRARPSNGSCYGEPDQYASIQKLSIDTAQKTGIFNNYTQHQLYEMSCKNGYNERYSKFSGQVLGTISDGATPPVFKNYFGAGSVIIIKPNDIPAASQQSFISHANKTFTMTVSADCKCPADGSYTLNVMAYYDDLVLYNEGENGKYESARPLLKGEDLASATVVFQDNTAQMNHVVGGNWFSNVANKVWSGITWLGDVLKSQGAKDLSRSVRNSGVIPQMADGAPFGDLASAFGYGKKPAKKRATKKGGELLTIGKGGKKLSKA